jgi:uncharacterized protein with PQ loop repeat
METNLPVLAGTLSTVIFVFSTLPMLLKAFQTKDLSSYSLGNILLSNVGNVVHSVYVFHLPIGPIWLLHAFYLVTTALMLFWYMRYEWRARARSGLGRREYPFAIPRLGNDGGALPLYSGSSASENQLRGEK